MRFNWKCRSFQEADKDAVGSMWRDQDRCSTVAVWAGDDGETALLQRIFDFSDDALRILPDAWHGTNADLSKLAIPG